MNLAPPVRQSLVTRMSPRGLDRATVGACIPPSANCRIVLVATIFRSGLDGELSVRPWQFSAALQSTTRRCSGRRALISDRQSRYKPHASLQFMSGCREPSPKFRNCTGVPVSVPAGLKRAASLTSSNGHMSDRRPTSLSSVSIQHPQRPRSFSSPAGLFAPVIPRGTRKPLSGRPPLRFGTACAG